MALLPKTFRKTDLGRGWFRFQFLWQEASGTRPISLLCHPGLGQIDWEGQRFLLSELSPDLSHPAEAPTQTPSRIRAVMAGTVAEMAVKAGDQVAEGDLLCILEAMKMRLEVTAPRNARVQAVAVTSSETVHLGQLLVELAESTVSD